MNGLKHVVPLSNFSLSAGGMAQDMEAHAETVQDMKTEAEEFGKIGTWCFLVSMESQVIYKTITCQYLS